MRRHGSSNGKSLLKSFFYSLVNKEFLIFVFFLCLSGVFWLLMALNETYDEDINVEVRLVNVPAGVVVTSDAVDTIRVTMRDKGYFILSYMYGNTIHGVDIDYGKSAKSQERIRVSSSDIQKILTSQLHGSTVITAVKPDHCDFYYTKGESKTVNVRFSGRIQAAPNYYIAKVDIDPKQVSVYASESLIDSIKEAITERVELSGINDTVMHTVELAHSTGVKYVPSEVKVLIYPDILIEETVEVPVTAVNMPEGKVLRTFPSKASVSFTVGASLYRDIDIGQFMVEADYNEISLKQSDKCRLRLTAQPTEVISAVLKSESVDYLIEEQ